MQVNYWWYSTGWKLSTLSTKDFEQIDDNDNVNLNPITNSFLKAISTTYKAMGHTEEAAKDARRRCYLDSTVYLLLQHQMMNAALD